MASHRHSKLKATAYHEAGHAVAAFLLHRGFRRVTIVPGEGFLGQLLKTAPPPPVAFTLTMKVTFGPSAGFGARSSYR